MLINFIHTKKESLSNIILLCNNFKRPNQVVVEAFVCVLFKFSLRTTNPHNKHDALTYIKAAKKPNFLKREKELLICTTQDFLTFEK